MAQYKEVPLYGGAYQSRSLIAAAQEAINVYPEANPEDSQAPTPVTNYLTPGLTPKSAAELRPVRCLYRTSNNVNVAVIGGSVYKVEVDFSLTLIGMIPYQGSPVTIKDNGIVAIIVDGTDTAYAFDIETLDALEPFGFAEGYLGATRIAFLDTFFLFNLPGTNVFYSSLSNIDLAMIVAGTAFDPLDIAAKTSRADPIQTLDVISGQIWLIGTFTTEVWSLVGGAGFPFARIQGAVINHGCSATYGEAQADASLFWLMQDDQGSGMVVQSNGYGVGRVSTHAMEKAIQSYSAISDCIMFTRQEDGHYFLVVVFPTADVTWEMDIQTKQWHKWASIDNNGNFHRHRSNCYAQFNGLAIVGDFSNGKLYELDPDVFTDGDPGLPIVRKRSFPVLVDYGHQTKFVSLILDMQPGEILTGVNPMVNLRISDDGGRTFPITLQASLGKIGEFTKSLKYGPPLGMARYRVYEVIWSAACNTSINRGWSKQKVMPW